MFHYTVKKTEFINIVSIVRYRYDCMLQDIKILETINAGYF